MYEIKDNILYFENILDSTETVEKLFQLFKFRLMSSFFFFCYHNTLVVISFRLLLGNKTRNFKLHSLFNL